MLDSHGEEIWLDLIEHFDLNIVDFLRGDVASTPRLILTMIRHLPEGSRYVAALTSAPDAQAVVERREAQEPDPARDARVWTQDRVLMAQLINAVNVLVRHTIPWEQGKAPQLPLIGPAAWRGEGPKAAPSKALSVMDVINRITGPKQ